MEFLREYCMEHGERRTFLRGETLEEAGEPAQWVAFVERGCFKYMVHNDEEGKDYCTGFAFEGEFVADLPLHRPQPLPSAHRPLSAGGADALAEGHCLVPQHHAHLPEQTTQGDYIRAGKRVRIRAFRTFNASIMR